MKIAVCLSLLILVSVFSLSQDSSKTTLTMLPNQIYSLRSGWIMNNQIISPWGIRNYLKVNPEALRLYNKGAAQNSFGQTVGLIGVAALLGSAIVINNDNHLSGKLSIGGLVFLFSGIFIGNGGDKKIEKAICIYNSTR